MGRRRNLGAADVGLIVGAGLLGFAAVRASSPTLGPVAGDGPPYAPNVARPGHFFSWDELTATSAPLPNEPNAEDARNLAQLTEHILDPLRFSLGEPLYVMSGYRTPQVNALVGGSDASQHTTGQAADIRADGWAAEGLADVIYRLAFPFDQLIWYAPERGGHVHVSFVSGGGRRAMLYAPASGGYVQSQPTGVA